MNAWARRGIQAAIFTGGMLALGAGIASANECCPDRPTPPLAATVAVPSNLCDDVLGLPGGHYSLSCIDRAVSTEVNAVSEGYATPSGTATAGTWAGGRHSAVRLMAGVPAARESLLLAEDRASVVGLAGRGGWATGVSGVSGEAAAATGGLDGSGLPAVGTLPDVPEFPDLAVLGLLTAGSHHGAAGPLPRHSAPAPQPDCVALPGKDCVATESDPDCVALPGKECVATESDPDCVAASGIRCVAPPAPGRTAGPALRVVQGGLAAARGGAQPAASSAPAAGGSPVAGGATAGVADPAVAALAELEMLRELVMELSGLVDLPVGTPTG